MEALTKQSLPLAESFMRHFPDLLRVNSQAQANARIELAKDGLNIHAESKGGGHLILGLKDYPQFRLHRIRAHRFDSTLERTVWTSVAEMLFSLAPTTDSIEIGNDNPTHDEGLTRILYELGRRGITVSTPAQELICRTEMLWQQATPWHRAATPAYPRFHSEAKTTPHPMRAQAPDGILYRRYIPWLGQTLSLRKINIEKDLANFRTWMNSSRIAQFWEEQGTEQQHLDYIHKQLEDPHVLPLIGSFDDQPFGYFEVYWVLEDLLAPFCKPQDYDRGLHLLVGDERFRGKRFYTAWFSSICHFIFLDDCRTERIFAEPRIDNVRQINNFDRSGFSKIKSFDFPHKSALLVMLLRERFFAERRYLPDLGDPTLYHQQTR